MKAWPPSWQVAEQKRYPELLALALYPTKTRGMGAEVGVGSRAAQPSQRSEEVPELRDTKLALGPAWTQALSPAGSAQSHPLYVVDHPL